MAVMGKWGDRTFEVSPKKINPFKGFSTSAKEKTDGSDSKKEGPDIDLEKISISVQLHANAGVDPEKEYNAWKKLIGKYNYFFIHGSKWGKHRFKLISTSLGSITMDDFGRMRLATLSLEFEEENVAAKKSGSKSTASSAEKKARK